MTDEPKAQGEEVRRVSTSTGPDDASRSNASGKSTESRSAARPKIDDLIDRVSSRARLLRGVSLAALGLIVVVLVSTGVAFYYAPQFARVSDGEESPWKDAIASAKATVDAALRTEADEQQRVETALRNQIYQTVLPPEKLSEFVREFISPGNSIAQLKEIVARYSKIALELDRANAEAKRKLLQDDPPSEASIEVLMSVLDNPSLRESILDELVPPTDREVELSAKIESRNSSEAESRELNGAEAARRKTLRDSPKLLGDAMKLASGEAMQGAVMSDLRQLKDDEQLIDDYSYVQVESGQALATSVARLADAHTDVARARVQHDAQVARAQSGVDARASPISAEFLSTTVARIGAVLLALFLTQILASLFRYAMRLSAFYSGCADALRLAASDMDLQRLATVTPLVAGDKVDFGTQIRTPSEQVIELAKILQKGAGDAAK